MIMMGHNDKSNDSNVLDGVIVVLAGDWVLRDVDGGLALYTILYNII